MVRLIALLGVLVAVPAAADPARGAQLRNDEWNVRIPLYGAGFAQPPPTIHLSPGQSLDRAFVRCDIDETTATRRVHCVPTTRAAAPADAVTGSFWTWAERTFAIHDVPPSRAAARRVERCLAASTPTGMDPTTIVIVDQTEWVIHDEFVARGCEHARGRPCDPRAVPTGRKIRVPERSRVAYLGAFGLPTDWTFTGPLLAMLGSGRTMLIGPELLVPFGTVHQDHVLAVLQNPYEVEHGLAYLAQVQDQEHDPDVRLALAWDRVVLAADAKDAAAFQRAFAAFTTERAARGPAPRVFDAAFQRALPLLELVGTGQASLVPPFGLPE